MVVKPDIERAFDKMDWEFLDLVLKARCKMARDKRLCPHQTSLPSLMAILGKKFMPQGALDKVIHYLPSFS